MPRCPECKLKVKKITKKEAKKDLKCKDCDFRFEETKSLEALVNGNSKKTKKKEIVILETELESLTKELDRILG